MSSIFSRDYASELPTAVRGEGVYLYDAEGKALGRIDTPERPLQLLFGGGDNQTLFILTHHSLYSLSVKGF